jgi:NADPH:quinone reductase-like Zn-dependent oxidoreductase
MLRFVRPKSMTALHLDSFAGVETLRLVEKPVPQPGRGEVLVRVRASPVNPSDVMFCRGLYGIDRPLPATPGFEGCGDVVAAGPGLPGRLVLGKRVACGGQSGDGLWAEYAVLPATSCLPLPGSLTDAQGACALVNPVTAWAFLEILRRERHRAVIQTAAASQLGRMLIRLCGRHGISRINVVHRPALAAALRGMGEEHVLDSSVPDFDDALREAAHRLGATVALDAVAGEMTGRLLRAMPSGRVIVYGALSGEPCTAAPNDLIFRNKSVEGFWLSEWIGRQNPLLLLVRLRAVLPLLGGDLGSEIAARVPLAEAPERLPGLLQSTSGGKTLLIPPGERPSAQ